MSLTPSHFQKRWSDLLGAFLEAWANQILYQRHVYPKETFVATRFLGIRCFVNRHPSVASYITDTVKVAVPSLVSGVATKMSLTIVDDGGAASHECEKYVLRFAHAPFPDAEQKNLSEAALARLERGVRDLLLSAHALESSRASSSESVSFRLTLFVPQEDDTCAELNEAFATGAWFALSKDNDDIPKAAVVRPLQHFIEDSVGSIQFASIKQQRGRKRPPLDSPRIGVEGSSA